jgi:ATP-dependent exoDNAse (exonuclease V) beta subunit
VGDAKQSIYRFRLAEVEVFSDAREMIRSEGGVVRHLERNFRSHPDILNLCNAFYPLVFHSSDKRYSQSYEPVSPLSVVGETGNRPRVKILFDPQEKRRLRQNTFSVYGPAVDFVKREQFGGETKLVATKRAIMFKDIAILLRKMRPEKGKEYTSALARHGIPYYTVGEAGFFEIPEIAGILAMLRVLSDPGDEMALTTALMSRSGWIFIYGPAEVQGQSRRKRHIPDFRPDRGVRYRSRQDRSFEEISSGYGELSAHQNHDPAQ